jgi:hypothetical protein
MRRRELIALLGAAAVVSPDAAGAAETGKVHRIAIVHPVRRVADMSEGGDRIYRVFFSELRRRAVIPGGA